jgi:hypothetical protein
MTVSYRYHNALAELYRMAETDSEFGDSSQALRALAEEFSESRDWLFELMRQNKHHPRVRWLAIDILRGYAISGFSEALIDALEKWPEDMALLGATVAVRFTKMPAQLRERVRDALRRRLDAISSTNEVVRGSVKEQLVSQWLAALGSFGAGEDLSRVYQSASMGSVGIMLNGLDAASRLARRECENDLVEKFFSVRASELHSKAASLVPLRHLAHEMGSVLWALVELLAARLAEESKVLGALAKEFPGISRRLMAEVKRAEELILRRNTPWLEKHRGDIEGLKEAIRTQT